jgi:hypothetical protein
MGVESVWAVQAKRSVMKCILNVERTFTELLVLQDQDVAVRETFQDQAGARAQAKALHARLLKRGWQNAG